ncbi:hypothetical protein [Streptomyces sp. NPDC006274]|uniref:hypothetical protein n=1 Tax=unclassified Streptomyces TaxID=2593676 RepID=UPI0033B1DE01
MVTSPVVRMMRVKKVPDPSPAYQTSHTWSPSVAAVHPSSGALGSLPFGVHIARPMVLQPAGPASDAGWPP